MSVSPFQMAAQQRLGGGPGPGGPPSPQSAMQPPTTPNPGADLNSQAAQGLQMANDALMQMLQTGQPLDEATLGPELQAFGQTLQILQAHAQSQQGAQAPGMGAPPMSSPGGAPPMGPGGY